MESALKMCFIHHKVFSVKKNKNVFLTKSLKRLSNQLNYKVRIQLTAGSPRKDFYKQGKKSSEGYRGIWVGEEGGGKRYGFPLRWCFRNSEALIKFTNLLCHWPSLVPVTLMEQTIYQKVIHFKALCFHFSTFCFVI